MSELKDYTFLIKDMTLEEKITMIHGAGFFRTDGIERLDIPGIHMSDGPNGVRQEFPDDDWRPVGDTADEVTWLPSNTTLASTWDPELAQRFGEVLGAEARGRGKDIILAPGINIKRTPLCGRNFEYMSEDPTLAGRLAAPLIRGIQSQGVAACVKHFALNNQEYNRMSVDVDVDDTTLHELYLPAFYRAITEGESMTIMAAYNRFRGDFCCESATLLQDILRDRWHYDGVAISDWGGVHHTTEVSLDGVDIEMSVTPDFDDYYMADPLYKEIKNGHIPESVVDLRVGRILKLIKRLHIGDPDRQGGSIDTREHQDIARQVAEDGIILLKNDLEHLPLKKTKNDTDKPYKILVVGDNATKKHAAGGGSAEINALYEITPMLGIRMVLGGNVICHWTPGHKISDVLRILPEYDEVIYIGGLTHDFDVEGKDREDMVLPYWQDQTIEALAEATDDLTVVLVTGSPVEMPWIDKVHSLIQTSYYGSQGGLALARVIFGDVNPSGRLPETYPIHLSDTPTVHFQSYPGQMGTDGHPHVSYTEGQMVGYRYYTTKDIPVLFPFGYGLSYTTFDIGDIHTDVTEDISDIPCNLATVSCTVTNTGDIYGKETLQLYVGVPAADRPKMVLRDFKKVAIEVGLKKTISLALCPRDFALYDRDEECFVAEPGTYQLYLGTSADDIIYHTSIELQGRYVIPEE